MPPVKEPLPAEAPAFEPPKPTPNGNPPCPPVNDVLPALAEDPEAPISLIRVS